ncbi:MAG TPA: hypothetical protein P5317_07600 [Myxococcota bacterium]|nr:hypothetical protein [Myxococcota bacterium]HRV17860.1 hypothetical protein [Myxococcota bacterium]
MIQPYGAITMISVGLGTGVYVACGGQGVSVAVGVSVHSGVPVSGVTVGSRLTVGVSLGVSVGRATVGNVVGDGVADWIGVEVGSAEPVEVDVDTGDDVADAVFVGDGTHVWLSVDVAVDDGIVVAVSVAVAVATVGDAPATVGTDCTGVDVAVWVKVDPGDGVAVALNGDGVAVAVEAGTDVVVDMDAIDVHVGVLLFSVALGNGVDVVGCACCVGCVDGNGVWVASDTDWDVGASCVGDTDGNGVGVALEMRKATAVDVGCSVGVHVDFFSISPVACGVICAISVADPLRLSSGSVTCVALCRSSR